jgi:hypothetical protein
MLAKPWQIRGTRAARTASGVLDWLQRIAELDAAAGKALATIQQAPAY